MEIPAKVEGKLTKFNDVISKEFPWVFPPMKIIYHKIDFVLGSSLPNKDP